MLILVAVPSVPVAAAGVSLVLERVKGTEDVGKWVRTGDVQRFRVRLNGMGKGAKVAVAANPVEALTEVTCTADARVAAGGGHAGSQTTVHGTGGGAVGAGASEVPGSAASGLAAPGAAGAGVPASGSAASGSAASGFAAPDLSAPGLSAPGLSGAGDGTAAASGVAGAQAAGPKAAGRLAARALIAAGAAKPDGPLPQLSAGASGTVPTAPGVAAAVPKEAVVPGARVCALGEVSGTKAVDVTVRAPEGARRVVVAAVARVRDGGKPTTMSRTAAVRVRGPITGDAATFSGPAHRLPAATAPAAQASPGPAAPQRTLARAAGSRADATRTGETHAGVVRTGRAHVAATPRDAGRDVGDAKPGKRTRTSTGASPGRRAHAGAANAGRRAGADAATIPATQAATASGTERGAARATGNESADAARGVKGSAARPAGEARAAAVSGADNNAVSGADKGAVVDAGAGVAGGVRAGATGDVAGGAPGLVLPEAVPGGPGGTGGVTGGGTGTTGSALSGSVPGAAGGGVSGGTGGQQPVVPSVAPPGSAVGDAGAAGTLTGGEPPLPWEMGVRAKPAKPIAWVSPIDGPAAFPLVVASIAVLMCGLWLVVTLQKRRKWRKVL
ncbi:hypothetical protein [Nonomuraea sp. NPDC049309]|uniref:hypothetical protein n=1 Tax=Nonomuraea sp. NPDC049309 TaxID=3364350 RepID=UPI00371F17FF